jgi:hypothetical protein
MIEDGIGLIIDNSHAEGDYIDFDAAFTDEDEGEDGADDVGAEP